jgi:hypothetical protein
MAVISNAAAGVYGFTCALRRQRFVLAMVDPGDRPPPGSILDGAIYRPSTLLINAEGRTFTIQLSWDEASSGTSVSWKYVRAANPTPATPV